ncbi:hypothetical protein LCGC14_1122780 [marine sediment metagenome]|uniref:Uncharacterized protein n=1 Tax=marine sediment metagenome TaxID=412755 RepID=A0A0F9MRB4_9ZZZZ
MHTAFHKEDELGDPVASDQLGAPQQQPVTSKSEAPRLAKEQEAKDFNRVKMGGFLMELGLNILSSNRDDAGAAFGDAANKTIAARDQRKRTRAAEDLAASERERKTRREDESDSLKEEKAARERRKEKRDIDKAELDKLQKFEMGDGSVGYYEKAEGPVYDESGKKIDLGKKDKDRLSLSSQEASYRDLRRAIGSELKMIEDGAYDAIDYDATDAEKLAYAKKKVKAQMKAARSLYSGKDVDNIDEEEAFADDDPLGLL